MNNRPLARKFAFACLWLFVFSMPIEKAIEIPGLGTISKLAGFVASVEAPLQSRCNSASAFPDPSNWLSQLSFCGAR